MGNFIPSPAWERQDMLHTVGAESLDALYRDVPAEIRLGDGALAMPQGMSEMEMRRTMERMAGSNRVFSSVFRGAGAYRHYIPAVVTRMAAKEAFVTAYTPYQPEISQGVLQSIFEYQTMICELTGMDAANASVYDGAVAAAEAAAMCRDRKRQRTLVSAAVHPETLRTIRTYAFGAGTEVALVPAVDGRTDLAALNRLLGDDAACVIVQSPNYFGIVEDVSALADAAHAADAKLVLSCNPIAAAAYKSAADCGADVAVGDGQPLGMPLSFGGPYLGFMACRQAMVRKLPGRIVGQTTDADGKRCFVLTLQAREQHIRREKASSNICSNQALCALTAAAYMATMGFDGMRQAANFCYGGAHALADKLTKIPGFALRYPDAPFFHEFVTTCPVPADQLMAALEQSDILGGLPLNNGDILWCVTEMNAPEDLAKLTDAVRKAVGK